MEYAASGLISNAAVPAIGSRPTAQTVVVSGSDKTKSAYVSRSTWTTEADDDVRRYADSEVESCLEKRS